MEVASFGTHILFPQSEGMAQLSDPFFSRCPSWWDSRCPWRGGTRRLSATETTTRAHRASSLRQHGEDCSGAPRDASSRPGVRPLPTQLRGRPLRSNSPTAQREIEMKGKEAVETDLTHPHPQLNGATRSSLELKRSSSSTARPSPPGGRGRRRRGKRCASCPRWRSIPRLAPTSRRRSARPGTRACTRRTSPGRGE